MTGLWFCAGLWSWYLSTWIGSRILAPFFIQTIRSTNAISSSPVVKLAVNTLYSSGGDFFCCFILAFLFGFFSKPSTIRKLLFVSGAVGVDLYGLTNHLINYLRNFSEIPSWAMMAQVQGWVSIVLIIPLLTIIGSNMGHYFNAMRYSKSKRWL